MRFEKYLLLRIFFYDFDVMQNKSVSGFSADQSFQFEFTDVEVGGGCFARLQAAWEEESIVSSREFHHHSLLHHHVIPFIKLGILELLKLFNL